MDDIDEEPRTQPCSAPEAQAGLRTFVQLYLVDEGLRRNPHPREEYYRYPETPPPSPPIHSPRTDARIGKELALATAERLQQFHAGRLVIRKEEAKQEPDPEQDPDYWYLKGEDWFELGCELCKEHSRRTRMEQTGEAEEGYAQEMLVSPTQSPSLAPLNTGFPELKPQLMPSAAKSSGFYKIDKRLPQSPARFIGLSQELLQLLEDSRNEPSTTTKGQKRTRCEGEGLESESLEHASRTKRQKRGIAAAQQKQEPVSTPKGPHRLGRAMARIPRDKSSNRLEKESLLQSPSLSDTLGTNGQNPAIVGSPKRLTSKVLSEPLEMKPLPQQPNLDCTSGSNSKAMKGRKSSYATLKGRDDGKRISSTPCLSKRKRSDAPNPPPTQKPNSVAGPARGPRQNNRKTTAASTTRARKPKKLQAPRKLPWALRSRSAPSYCETGTRAA